MLTCPQCNSEFVFFSKKNRCYVCEECGNKFNNNTALKIFFSYGHDKNTPVVEKIRQGLEERGHDVWIDHNKIILNDDWRQKITQGIIDSDEVVSFLSKHSVRNPGVCRDEIQIAISLKNERVIRILLEESTRDLNLTTLMSSRQYLDMRDWEKYYQQGGDSWDNWFNGKMAELIKCVEDPENQQFSGEITDLMNRLKPIDYCSRSQRLLEKPFCGREWLLDEYEKWKQDAKSKTFLLSGIPGAGKSVIASRLAEYDVDIIAMLFFEFGRKEMSDMNNIIDALSFQIACKLPDYREYLLRSIKSNSNLLELKGRSRFDSLIVRPLNYSIDGNRDKLVIVIDALDEGYELNHEMITELISSLNELPSWIKVFYTSRTNNAVEGLLGDARKIYLGSQQNDADIERFLKKHFFDKNELFKIVRSCQGCFLCANLIYDAAESGDFNISQIDEFSGLYSFYSFDFARKFSAENIDSYQKYLPVLELLCASGEIPEAIVSELINYNKYQLEDFKRTFSDYIVVREVTRGKHCYRSISFFHKSVKDWLCDAKASNVFFVDVRIGARLMATKMLEIVKSKNKTYLESVLDSANLLPNMLIKAEMYVEYKDFLIEGHGHAYWDKVACIPQEVDIKPLYDQIVKDCIDIKNKARPIISNYQKLDFDIFCVMSGSYRALAACMSDSRFAGALIDSFNCERISPFYFCTPLSDLDNAVSDTKFWLGSALSDCIDQADIHGYEVPDEIRREVDLYKLCTCFYEGDIYKSFVTDLRQDKRYHYDKEMCLLDESELKNDEELIDLRNYYNSVCLWDYILLNIDSPLTEDMQSHMHKLIRYGADIATVREMCTKYMNRIKNNGASERSLNELSEKVEKVLAEIAG